MERRHRERLQANTAKSSDSDSDFLLQMDEVQARYHYGTPNHLQKKKKIQLGSEKVTETTPNKLDDITTVTGTDSAGTTA